VVEAGERLVDIGAEYGVPWRAIADANGITEPWIIRPGSRLEIPD